MVKGIYRNKRAMSTIIITIIMIAFALVAIGVVWAVVTNLLSGRTEAIDYESKCLDSNIDVTAFVCSAAQCNVTIQRRIGAKEVFDGIGIVVSNGTAQAEAFASGNIDPAATVSLTVTDGASINEVRARAYYTDTAGTNHYCSTETYP